GSSPRTCADSADPVREGPVRGTADGALRIPGKGVLTDRAPPAHTVGQIDLANPPRPDQGSANVTVQAERHPVDRYRPLHKMVLFGAQHVLVMAATPISSVFLISAACDLTPELTVDLLAAAFVLSGLGSILQSLGPWKIGARLPFVMLPGGAPVVLFAAIAQQHG